MSQLKKIQSSLLEMKSIYALAAIAMLLALRIVLGFFANSTLPFFGNNVKLSAAFLPIAVTGVMFGPIPAAIVGALGDILSFIIAPTGAYFPGFTINGFITGFIYGMFLYKNNVTPLRVVLAWFTNSTAAVQHRTQFILQQDSSVLPLSAFPRLFLCLLLVSLQVKFVFRTQ